MRVFLHTYGCRANQYDTEAVRATLLAAGHEVVPTAREADAAVFNSCAVTAEAEADLRAGVRRAARQNPALHTVVMGCAAALEDAPGGDRGLRALPTVRQVVGGADVDGVARALGVRPGAERAPAAGARWTQTGSRALLRIQDGCDEHCTFCATRLARGASRSRPPAELVAEARALAEHHPEIVLTGVHIGGYGADLGASLGVLVERLVREVPAVRFRLSSVEATEVDDRLAELLSGAPDRLAPFLHAPLQSGSDRVLRRMGRHWYTAARYAAAVERIARRQPVFGLGADVLAGFPGEDDADHRATVALVRSLPFTALHVFPYSLRPGTAAERLPARVHGATIARRVAELRALGEAGAAQHRAARAGGSADVVVIGDGARREGITEDNLRVALSDPTLPRRSRVRATLELSGAALLARVGPV